MSTKQIERVVCDGCFVEADMSPGAFMAPASAPDGWAKLNARDLCPSCNAAVLRFLFCKERMDIVLADIGKGHQQEQAELASSRGRP